MPDSQMLTSACLPIPALFDLGRSLGLLRTFFSLG
jgi:hypothetical protein